MKTFALLATLLILAAVPGLCADILYDGSTDIQAFGWRTWEGVYQGSTDGDVWHLNDVGGAKTKLKYGNNGVPVDPDTGVYLESRMKCVYIDRDSTPLNLGLWITGGVNVRREMTVQPSKIVMDNKSYAGTFSDYRVIRMVYKRLDLRVRGIRQHSWAVYLDGSDVPVLWTKNSSGAPGFGGPTWGAGNTSDVQDLYFDYVNYYDDGAFTPGMDGSITFTNGDPDGMPSSDATSFTIGWQTSVATTGTLYYKRASDTSYTEVADLEPGYKTSHSITVTGTIPGDTYHYYVVSTDSTGRKIVSLPAEIVLNPFYISSGPEATVIDAKTCTITWETTLPDASSEVHYGLWPGVVEPVVVEPGGGGKTSHSVTLTNLKPGSLYYYYVKTTSADPQWGSVQSGVEDNADKLQIFSTSIPGDEYLDNTGFEVPDTAINQGLSPGARDRSPWVKFGNFDGIYRMFGLGDWRPKLAYCAGHVAQWSASGNMGGLYQTIPTVPGEFYEAKVHIWTRRQSGPIEDPPGSGIWVPSDHPSSPLDVSCRIGIDPYGGTDPGYFEGGVWKENPNISWSPWFETSNSCTDNNSGGNGGPWEEIGAGVIAMSTTATVFLQQQHKYPLNWNISGFDDASWGTMAAPPGNIKDTLQIPDGYPAKLTGKVVTGVFENLYDNSFEQVFYIEETDRSAGIKVVGDFAVMPRDKVDVVGYMQTVNGERQIHAYDVTAYIGDTLPDPFGLANKTVEASAKPVGMRVKLWGKVSSSFGHVTLAGQHFYLDDGSGLRNGNQEGFVGLLVLANNATGDYYEDGDYVVVDGVLGNYAIMVFDGTPPAPVPLTVPVIWATEVTKP